MTTSSGNLTLYIGGPGSGVISDTMNLYLESDVIHVNNSITLYTITPSGSVGTLLLYLRGPVGSEGWYPSSGSMNLYISRYSEAVAKTLSLFTKSDDSIHKRTLNDLKVEDVTEYARHGLMAGFMNDFCWSDDRPSGMMSHSLWFTSNNAYVIIDDNNAFSFTNGTTDLPFSISTWIKTCTDDEIIFDKYSMAGGDEYKFYITGGGLYLNVYDSGTMSYIGRGVAGYTTYAPSGVWNHIVATYDGSSSPSGIKIYINKTRRDDIDKCIGLYEHMYNTGTSIYIGRHGDIYDSDYSVSPPTSWYASSTRILGRLMGAIHRMIFKRVVESGSPGIMNPIDMKLSDLKLYNTELNTSEVNNLYSGHVQNDLIGRWMVHHNFQHPLTLFISSFYSTSSGIPLYLYSLNDPTENCLELYTHGF